MSDIRAARPAVAGADELVDADVDDKARSDRTLLDDSVLVIGDCGGRLADGGGWG